uniref:Uncharacterized protein n=1 Tax=Vespula pensylvanica TaxID=30213 RepID=A0A834U953_VESPE|nr:hypothetical protein H0235_008710 [Vespula pensylvanica]
MVSDQYPQDAFSQVTVTSGPSRILPFITNPIGRGRVFLALESAGEFKGNVDTSISSSFDGSNEVTGTTVISSLYYEVSGKDKTCRKIYRLQDLLFSKHLTREFMLSGILSDKTIIDSGRNKASALSFVISIRSSKEELRFCEHEANAYFSCVPSQASDRNVLPSTQELNSLQITYLKIVQIECRSNNKKTKQLSLQSKETNPVNFIRLLVMRLVFGVATSMGLGENISGVLGGIFVPPGAEDYADYADDDLIPDLF